jgi:hypothetical protein
LRRLGLLQLVFLFGFSRVRGRKRRLQYCKGNHAGAKYQTPDLWFALDHRSFSCKVYSVCPSTSA